jgi:FkbM family methyltransferase
MTPSEKKFVQRTTSINKIDYKLIWPAEDNGCFNIISRDWDKMYGDILNNTPTRKLVVQAGGNCGLYPFKLAFDFEKVFTFEPDPVNFYCLSNNCKTNKIVKFNSALGDKNTFLTIGNKTPSNVGMNKIGDGEISIYSISLDSLNLPALSLLFLDIEGYEFFALKGAEKTIKKFRPTIVFELSPGEKEFIFNFLAKHNYQPIKGISGNSHNFIFIPKERA